MEPCIFEKKKRKKNKLVAIFSFSSQSTSKEITITVNLIPNINVSLSRIARPSKSQYCTLLLMLKHRRKQNLWHKMSKELISTEASPEKGTRAPIYANLSGCSPTLENIYSRRACAVYSLARICKWALIRWILFRRDRNEKERRGGLVVPFLMVEFLLPRLLLF